MLPAGMLFFLGKHHVGTRTYFIPLQKLQAHRVHNAAAAQLALPIHTSMCILNIVHKSSDIKNTIYFYPLSDKTP